MGTLMLAVALLVQPADSVTVPGVVVDTAGKPVSDVEVVLAAPRRSGESSSRWRRRRPTLTEHSASKSPGNGCMGITSHSNDLGLPSRPDGRRSIDRARGDRSLAAGPTDPGCTFQTDGDDPRSRRPSAGGCSAGARPLRKQRPRPVPHS